MSSPKASDGVVELRRRAEKLVRAAAPGSVPADLRRTLHELQVHQIELEMQNKELRRSQEQLETERARYFDFYNLAPVGFLSVSQAGLILEANATAAGMLGVARGSMVKQPARRFVAKEDQGVYSECSQQLFETGRQQACDLRLARLDGTVLWVRVAATRAPGAEGRPVARLVLSDITHRKQAEESTCRSLHEKEALLREIHHRVKNNMQVVSSLLRLQFGRIDNPAAKAALQDMEERVRSMALIHEHLYRSADLASVNLADYLGSLCQELFHALVTPARAIRLELDLAPVGVVMDQALPCGLLVSELVSNALKHAFPEGRGGDLRVELQRAPGGSGWRLRVADNGVGLPPGLALEHISTLGLRLVSDLARQMGGHLEVHREAGTAFDVDFRETRA